jgi:hypothetical protein
MDSGLLALLGPGMTQENGSPRFRTIQVYPKDLQARPRQAEGAASGSLLA